MGVCAGRAMSPLAESPSLELSLLALKLVTLLCLEKTAVVQSLTLWLQEGTWSGSRIACKSSRYFRDVSLDLRRDKNFAKIKFVLGHKLPFTVLRSDVMNI